MTFLQAQGDSHTDFLSMMIVVQTVVTLSLSKGYSMGF